MGNFDIEGALAIVGIFFVPFATIILIVYFSFRARQNRQKQQMELYVKAMELGKELPANFFQPAHKRNLFNRGFMCVAVGVGVGIFFVLTAGIIEGVAFGAIPFCVGLAYLLIHFVGKKRDCHEQR